MEMPRKDLDLVSSFSQCCFETKISPWQTRPSPITNLGRSGQGRKALGATKKQHCISDPGLSPSNPVYLAQRRTECHFIIVQSCILYQLLTPSNPVTVSRHRANVGNTSPRLPRCVEFHFIMGILPPTWNVISAESESRHHENTIGASHLITSRILDLRFFVFSFDSG